jgi:putative DNA methylase
MGRSKQQEKSKKELVAEAVAKVVRAGEPVAMTTVDFSDPNRPKTCLEVDFPILPVNQVAIIEGNAGKPIYQMSKWWARRRSSVFRSLLIAAATKAPDDPAEAAKTIWDMYYCNHQKKGAFKHLKVADIFMGGGTTVVEGSRLGMQMFGNDLNPVAWFVVKSELAKVDLTEVEALLADIEADVKPQIMPFYACRGPNGEKGNWFSQGTGKLMSDEFKPWDVPWQKRKDYRYEGPEIIYTFWAKHGPCQVTGCGHRTPIFTSPVIAVKELTVPFWEVRCPECKAEYHVERGEARMAPDVPLILGDGEKVFALMDKKGSWVCPHCEKNIATQDYHKGAFNLEKPEKKKVSLTLLIHPDWMKGEASGDKDGAFGGSPQDDAESTVRWSAQRAKKAKLIEVRGGLPEEIVLPGNIRMNTGVGTVPKKSHFACGKCGTVQGVLDSVKASGKAGPIAPYAVQAYSPKRDLDGHNYGGRYFQIIDEDDSYAVVLREWEQRKEEDLKGWWPESEIPYGFMTAMNNGDIRLGHGFTHWWKMFTPRQLLVHSLLLKAICRIGSHKWEVREFVLAVYQQYLRNNNLFTIWNHGADKIEPMFSNSNYHPKSTMVENCVFPNLGRGNWASSCESLSETLDWSARPYEVVANTLLSKIPALKDIGLTGKSEKTFTQDPILNGVSLSCGSATDLEACKTGSQDLVITDPPFGGLLHYSELSDFFYVWLRLALKDKYPELFSNEYTPKTMEVVANRARQPENSDAFYQRLLTASWSEAHRILKPGGILAFTFHHSEDEPWVSVLESLFDAGFILECAYPIRSDETKGEGSKPGTFGSQKIEFDIIHVCRKRTEDPVPVSWAKMRKQVLNDIRDLQSLLEHHQKSGLLEADMQVIRRGKALEYFSKHYGKVFLDNNKPMSVKEALAGIHQILNEGGEARDLPPVQAEPMTRQFLRLFRQVPELERDQMQKYLRGSGISPSDFEALGWGRETKKIMQVVPPLEMAQAWIGKRRDRLSNDYEQAMVLTGACYENSGVNASDTLNNENFTPHPALAPLLEWFQKHGHDVAWRNAAQRALILVRGWRETNKSKAEQLDIFYGEGP